MLISDYLSSNTICNLHSFFDLTHFRELGQKYKNIFLRFLVQMKTLKFAFEINWPLVIEGLLKENILLQYPSKSVAGDNCPLSPLISPALSIICQHSTSHKSKIPPLPWTLELLEWKQLWGFSFNLRSFRMTAVIGFIISRTAVLDYIY